MLSECISSSSVVSQISQSYSVLLGIHVTGLNEAWDGWDESFSNRALRNASITVRNMPKESIMPFTGLPDMRWEPAQEKNSHVIRLRTAMKWMIDEGKLKIINNKSKLGINHFRDGVIGRSSELLIFTPFGWLKKTYMKIMHFLVMHMYSPALQMSGWNSGGF